MGHMSCDHEADSVSERKTHVEHPGDQVLGDNVGRGIQPKVGNRGHANEWDQSDQSRTHRLLLVPARLDHMLESVWKCEQSKGVN